MSWMARLAPAKEAATEAGYLADVLIAVGLLEHVVDGADRVAAGELEAWGDIVEFEARLIRFCDRWGPVEVTG